MTADTPQDKPYRGQARFEAQAARAAQVSRLQAGMPQAMRDRKQWLLWKLETVQGRDGLQKVPYYVAGRKRGGELGGPKDRAALAEFDAVLKRYAASADFAGIGFAFLDGDGLIGIDLDWKHNVTGDAEPLHNTIMERVQSFTEFSPSGKGVHIIVQGQCDSFKSDAIGVEVYCGGRYFTCTGDRLTSAPAEVLPIEPEALAFLEDQVQQAKDAAKLARQAAEPQVAAAKPAPPRPVQRHATVGQQTNDFRTVNDAAHQQLAAWVPLVFSQAKTWRSGYRVSSKALGRELQEDLQLLPEGIMDFGEELGMSPIDVVLKWQPGMSSPKDALIWLASALGITLSAPRPRLSVVPRADDGYGDSLGQLVRDQARLDRVRPIHTMHDDEDGDAGDKKRKARLLKAQVKLLCKRYVLVYSTDEAWDSKEQMLVRVPALRLAFSSLQIKHWLASEDRRMVRPVDLVFEPGQTVQWPQINMFDGMTVKPTECTQADVQPMLDLLRHLCSESASTPEGVADLMHWVLCWQALPLQQLGAKMQSGLVFHGAQGTGKNLYWDLWRDLFGLYGITVGQSELEDKFNTWLSRKLAIVGDEVVSRQEMYHNKNTLKRVVTQETKFPIRGMHKDVRWESNHANVVFLSNESVPLALEDRDRRYLVVYTPLEADATLYQRVRDFKEAGGIEKWLHYLQHYDVGDFDAHTKPPMTAAKAALIEANWKPAARFGFEWLEGVLDLPVRVCSAEQLYRAFRHWCDQTGARWPPDQAGFTSELNRWAKERVKRGADGKFEDPELQYRIIALKAHDVEDNGKRIAGERKSVRCWLPRGTGPLNGVSVGAWAWDSVQTFETDLRRYRHRFGNGAAGAGEGADGPPDDND